MPRKDSIILPDGTPATSARRRLERLFPDYGESSTLYISCHSSDYSASKIAHAVEDCNAHLINLNVTSDNDPESGRVGVELRVNHLDPEAVARSLERYGFEVNSVYAPSAADDSVMRHRYEELMHYLNI